MQLKKTNLQVEDGSIKKVLLYGVMLVFVFTSDAIMSYWSPGFIQRTLGGSAWMGLVMAFSSVIGFLVDLAFPQLLRGIGTRMLLILLVVTSFMFPLSMYGATWLPVLLMLLLGMAIWGVYYEIMAFASQQFVSANVSSSRRATAWGIIGVFRSLAYLVGPVIAGFSEKYSDRTVLLIAMGLSLTSSLFLMFSKMSERKAEVEYHEVNLWEEINHWKVLFVHVWPVVILSITMGLIDSTFWTVGTIWADKLSHTSPYGNFFLTAYMLPSLFVGLVVAKMGIYEHKKKIASVLLFLSYVSLMGVGVSSVIWWQLLVVLVSSTLSSFAFPLVDAVYSDIVSRMGRERKHLIGLSSSTFSLAYILGPIISGFSAQFLGESFTFTLIAGLAAVVVGILIFVTPKKLKIPQKIIATWD